MHTHSSSSSFSQLSRTVHPPSYEQQASQQQAELPSRKRSCGLCSRAFSHALLAALLCNLLLSTPLQAARTAPPPSVSLQVDRALTLQLTEAWRFTPSCL